MTRPPDAFPVPAHIRFQPGGGSFEFELVRNTLGEAWMQYLVAGLSAIDGELRARGIAPDGPIVFVGEAQGLTLEARHAHALSQSPTTSARDWAAYCTWFNTLRARYRGEEIAPAAQLPQGPPPARAIAEPTERTRGRTGKDA